MSSEQLDMLQKKMGGGGADAIKPPKTWAKMKDQLVAETLGGRAPSTTSSAAKVSEEPTDPAFHLLRLGFRSAAAQSLRHCSMKGY